MNTLFEQLHLEATEDYRYIYMWIVKWSHCFATIGYVLSLFFIMIFISMYWILKCMAFICLG